MLLSTIICPQYLRGVGVCGRFRVCPPSLPFPSLFTVTSMRYIILHIITYSEKRETATSSRYSYALTPNAHIPWQKALLLYYLIVILERNTLYFSTLDALYMNPKGSQAFCFHTWRASWTYVRHILDTPCSLGNRLIPPFGRLDHETSLATANIRPISPENAVFRLPSKSPNLHKPLCRGFNVKNPTF